MKQLKDFQRFQPDSQFLIRLEQELKQESRRSNHQPIWSISALVASIVLLLWIFPNRVDSPSNEFSTDQELVFLQENFEDSEENLELLTGKLPHDSEDLLHEEELIDELKTMY